MRIHVRQTLNISPPIAYMRRSVLGLLIGYRSALAVIPQPTAPSTNPQSGDYIGLMKGYAKDAGAALALILAVSILLACAYAILHAFMQALHGKQGWGHFGLVTGVAGGVMVVCLYLLNQASTII